MKHAHTFFMLDQTDVAACFPHIKVFVQNRAARMNIFDTSISASFRTGTCN